MIRQTCSEWEKEGESKFGKDRMEWKFVCPECGKISSMQDFDDLGANNYYAKTDCIGRYNDEDDGCNYTSDCESHIKNRLIDMGCGETAEYLDFADIETQVTQEDVGC